MPKDKCGISISHSGKNCTLTVKQRAKWRELKKAIRLVRSAAHKRWQKGDDNSKSGFMGAVTFVVASGAFTDEQLKTML